MRRKWIKLWVDDWLDGSIRRDLSDAERGVWADFLAMAGHSRNPGVIQYAPGLPYDHRDLANRLRTPIRTLESTLRKCKLEGRITEDTEGIHITNFFKYQSHLRAEIKAQLPFPEPGPPGELTPEQLQQQAEIDAQYLDILKDKVAKGIEDSHTQPYPDRIAAAEKWKAEHPEK